MTPMRSRTIPTVRVSCTQIRTALLLLALAALGNPVRAQAPPPAATATEMRFDVASIKPNRETFEEHFIRPASNGQSSFRRPWTTRHHRPNKGYTPATPRAFLARRPTGRRDAFMTATVAAVLTSPRPSGRA